MKFSILLKAPFAAVARAWRRRLRAQEWKHQRREFVYLDETSVTSLVAARYGSVPESFKDTASDSTSSQTGGSFSLAPVPAGPGVSMSKRATSSKVTSQEVVRRAVAQGTFRSLRIGDTDLRISVEDQPDRPSPGAVGTIEALTRHLPKLAKQHRAVRVEDLLRGDVIEVRVELSPEWTYQFTTAVSSMVDLIEGRAEMFGIEQSAIGEVRQAHEILSGLLVDLVPLQARVTSHRLVTVENVLWLIDNTMIKDGSRLHDEASEVHLAGVTELPLYWKDVRRVLFAGSVYSVYARLSRPGIQSSWSPVKMTDVFDLFLPEMGDGIRRLPYMFDKDRSVPDHSEAPLISDVVRDKGLIPFGRALAGLVHREIQEESLQEAASIAARSVATQEELEDVGIVRRAYESMVKAVEDFPPSTELSEPTKIDRNLVRGLREVHQKVVDLTLLNDLAVSRVPESSKKAPVAGSFLEAEVVAIYW